jgi:UDP:flavonoid glycosyltransferase YjiC (YdhE family)
MRILFHMLPEHGHLLPSFPLARALKARGHEVIYTSILPDLDRVIEARGYPRAPLYTGAASRGDAGDFSPLSWTFDAAQRFMRVMIRRMDDLLSGAVEARVGSIDPAVVIADVIESPMALVAHRLGIPCLRLSTSFSQRLTELPPLTSALPPDASYLELEAARWAASCLRIDGQTGDNTPYRFDVLATKFGYPVEHISFRSVFVPDLTLYPEVLLCASALDFPQRGSERPTYVACPVELDRSEEVPRALDQFCDGQRPLLYVSLGSRAGRYPGAARFFEAVMEVLRARPSWQAVVATGDQDFDREVLAGSPGNVFVLRGAPQLWLLRRAAVFVTHAGLGSVREAVALRVPMIAVPQQFDQPGNAARVAHHGLGVYLPMEAADPAGLSRALDTILRDRAGYKARLEAMSEACQREERGSGVMLVERMAAGRAAARPQSSSQPREAQPITPGGASRLGWLFVSDSGQLPGGGELIPLATLTLSKGEGTDAGSDRFTIYPDIKDALSHATGSVVARVEVAGAVAGEGGCVLGETLTCHWLLDAASALYDFAAWCAELALEPELQVAPETAALWMDTRRRARALSLAGAPLEARVAAYQRNRMDAVPLVRRGYGVAVAATHPYASDAAYFSRAFAVAGTAWLRASEGDPAARAARFDEAYGALLRRTSAELVRRIASSARGAGILLDADAELGDAGPP